MTAQTQLLLCKACSHKRNGMGYGQGITHYNCTICGKAVIFSNGGLPLARICLECATTKNLCEDCGNTARAQPLK